MKNYTRKSFLYLSVAVILVQTNAFAQRRPPEAERFQSESLRSSYRLADYFPLQVGNEWVYTVGDGHEKVQVLGETKETNGYTYFEIARYFFSMDIPTIVRKVRVGPLGQILEYNPDGEDWLWYRFGLFSNSWIFETEGNTTCVAGSSITSHIADHKVEVPAGAFENTVRLDFTPQCADMGIINEYFARGVGLVRRVEQTIAGPRTYNLVSARVGSFELPKVFYGIEVQMDKPLYYNNLMPPISDPSPTAQVLLVVRNYTDIPLEFAFGDAQRYDFIVSDALGNEVLRWSDEKAFVQVVGKETVVNGSLRYSAEITLKKRDGGILPAGFYTLTGYLTLAKWQPGFQKMTGTITFEIQNVH